MKMIERQIEQTQETKRGRGGLIAGALIAIVGVIAAVVIVAGNNDGATSAGSDLTPLQTAELAWERLEGGDPEGFHAVLSPDVTVTNPGRRDAAYFETNEAQDTLRLSLGFYAKAVSLDPQCTATGNVVACTLTPVSPLGEKNDAGEPTNVRTSVETFTVTDGVVTLWEQDVGAPTFDERRKAEYEAWLEESYTEAHAELFAFGSMIYEDRDGAGRHRAFIQEWAASQ